MDNVNVELIEFIQNNSKSSFVEIEGVTYNQRLDNSLTPIDKVLEESYRVEKSLKSNFLTGIVDYLQKNPDKLNLKDMIVRVEDYKSVFVESALRDYGSRLVYIETTFKEPDKRLNSFNDMENFLINLNSTFEDTEELREFIQIVSSVRDYNEKNISDDGVTQIASTKAGVDLVSEKRLPKFITLKPITTFFEVDQPRRPFLFRVKKNGSGDLAFALFECDGGAYRNNCIKRIKDYLLRSLPEEVVVIA